MPPSPSSSATGARVPGRLLQALAAAAALLVIAQAAPYLSLDRRFAFLVERPWLTGGSVWYSCFILHIVGGIVCLVAAPFLLWNGTSGGSRRLHRAIGRVYAVASLGWVAPTGAWLAISAKGGLAGQLGFALLVSLFAWCSVDGMRAVRRGDLRAHVACMVRAYAVLLSAFLFRALHRALPAMGMGEDAAYVASTWGSLVLSVLAGECACWRLLPIRPRPHFPVTIP